MASAEIHDVPLRVQGAVYATALFNGNLFHMASVVLPLWAITLDPSPLFIGIFLGSRQILPVLLSIHGGAMMDRFGARRVILVFGVVGIVSMSLFPAMPWMAAAIALQMFSGLAEAINWIGAQTFVGQILRGHPVYAGRMMFVMRLGGFAGPPLIGLTWDIFGPWGAFGILGAWVACGWVAAWILPKSAEDPARTAMRRPLTSRDVLPRLSDYLETFRLLAIPAVALVIACTMVRQSGSGVQASFYVVYLEGIGISGAGIGMLLGLSAAVSAVASLGVAPLTRRVRRHWLLLAMVVASIVTIMITPLLGGYMLLAIALGARGAAQGFNLPLLITIGSGAVGPDAQGKMVALRITMNRACSALIPIIMGAVAEFAGLANSFYIVGGGGLALLAAMAFWVGRSPAFRGQL